MGIYCLNLSMEKSRRLQVAICGGGNGAHFSAAVIGSRADITVNVLTRRPEAWKREIVAHTAGSAWENRGNIRGRLNVVSSEGSLVSRGTNVFIICGPAHIHLDLLRKIAPYIEPNSYVGTLYGQGGFDWMANHIITEEVIKQKNITIFGLQNIPSICKIRTYGEAVNVIGPKDALYAAAAPVDRIGEVCKLMETLFGIPTVPLPNFLSITLTPSNQIIHPGRLYGLFKDWDGKQAFDPAKIPLLYEDMDDISADWMQRLDDEIQAIKTAIIKYNPHIDLTNIIPMKERIIKQYGAQIRDKTNMRTVFATNLGYSTLKVPVKKVEGGVIPDIDGRLFWEDVPFGLVILKDIADILGVKTPAVDTMIEWHQRFMGKTYITGDKLNRALIGESGAPSRYGIKTPEDLLRMSMLRARL
eukprot:TRINITY_DN315_c0_g1_i4.p1 TRINITY_DN315_c0_g1~~TRINITY_DN315_c0_g1_i4.p1  ORF type:complete len:415 (+),score=83.93 TRINITY_DN315_c0_g1_i4:39-1283(+)